jgi:hypothetical protein
MQCADKGIEVRDQVPMICVNGVDPGLKLILPAKEERGVQALSPRLATDLVGVLSRIRKAYFNRHGLDFEP